MERCGHDTDGGDGEGARREVMMVTYSEQCEVMGMVKDS